MAKGRKYNPPTAQDPAKVAIRQVTVQQTRSRPLPDPQTLREYETLLPSSGDRIIAMAEREQDFAHT